MQLAVILINKHRLAAVSSYSRLHVLRNRKHQSSDWSHYKRLFISLSYVNNSDHAERTVWTSSSLVFLVLFGKQNSLSHSSAWRWWYRFISECHMMEHCHESEWRYIYTIQPNSSQQYWFITRLSENLLLRLQYIFTTEPK